VLPRSYVPDARAEGEVIELPDDEARHLTRVLRFAPGDRLRVFNGRGTEWNAVMDSVAKQRVTVRLERQVPTAPEPRTSITLAVAVLKGDKMDEIVRDAVMLGVTAIRPLLTTRTEISRASLDRSSRIERWNRIAVSSAKQCGRAVVPAVQAAEPFEHVIPMTTDGVMLVEPAAAADAVGLGELKGRQSLTLIVGPEGGWTADEVQRARANGTMLLTLGAHTLRADAVPIVALTACRVRLEDF
jgi:16S rRNA (uracil1498-N3)-methyltransferase